MDTFRLLLDRVRTALELGESMILDAPWWPEVERVAARLVAGEIHSELLELATVDASGRPGVGTAAAHPADPAAVEVEAQAGGAETEPWPEHGRSTPRARGVCDWTRRSRPCPAPAVTSITIRATALTANRPRAEAPTCALRR
jgi:predicted kinase